MLAADFQSRKNKIGLALFVTCCLRMLIKHHRMNNNVAIKKKPQKKRKKPAKTRLKQILLQKQRFVGYK